jgi:hypothetical protein
MSAIDVGGFRSLLSTVSVATALILQHHDIEPPTPRNKATPNNYRASALRTPQ